MSDLITRVKVLHGHVDQDSAYLVDDYPYGRKLRCEIRYWVDTSLSGAKTGQQRFASQTTNPKRAGLSWNNPHYSTYSSMVVLFLNEDEHVKHWHVDNTHVTPEGDARLRLFGVYDQLTEVQREQYEKWLQRSKRYAEPWRKWAETLFELAMHLEDNNGEVPVLENNVWVMPDGQRRYLGMTDTDHAVYFTAARQLLTVG